MAVVSRERGYTIMKTRIISGLAMLPLAILVYVGGLWLQAAAFLVAIIGLTELYNGLETMGVKPARNMSYTAIFVLYLLNLIEPGNLNLIMMWVVGVTMASLIYGFNLKERKTEDITSTLFGLIYVVFFSFHIVLIDQSEHRILIWLVFLAAFGTDIMAYFTGMAIGKHKLCPNLSPKKSKEGAVGGVVGSVILCGIFGYLLGQGEQMLIACLAIGFVGSIVAQLGDLSASAFKRQMGIKDYGNLIPGHGGILDRFDSVLFTAPLVYYVMQIILG